MHRRRREQIVHPPHGARQLRLRQNPPAAQPAHPVHLRQAAGHHELRAQVERRSRRILVHRVQVDLVHQHPRAHAARDLPDLAQHALPRQHARWIVQIRHHNQLRPRRDRPPHRLRIHRVPALMRARKPLHHRAHVLQRVHQQPVRGMLDQHLVSRLQQRRERQVVRSRSPRRRHHAIRVHPVPAGDRAFQRRVAVAVVAIDLERRQLPQLAERKRAHPAGRQIEPGATLRLRPMHVLRLFMCHRAPRLRLQYQYTGIPVNIIPHPRALFSGSVITVLATIPAQAATNKAVVYGCPGAR